MSRPRQSLPDLSTVIANHVATTGPLHQTASIDLHGLSVEKARATVITQIKLAPEKRWDKIRFITGRGNHVNAKGNRGTIYKSFQEWLQVVNNAPLTVEQFDGFYEISFVNENTIYNPLEALFNQEIHHYLSSEIESIKTAAAKKDFDAMMALALCYDKGIGVSKDYRAATALYKEIAETRKDSLAQFETGCRYFIGIGVRQNDLEAVRYLALSAAQGYVLAEFLLGSIFHKGTETIPVDLARAHRYFIAAASHKNAEAARKAGSFYYQGLGCTPNLEAAVMFWEQGAERGDKIAAFNLVHAYETGEGVKRDSSKADYFLRLAAKLGDRDGQFLLGLKLFFGLHGAAIDIKTGLRWIKEAAKQNHSDALMFLFRIEFAAGNTTQAGEHVIAAARAGEITAQYHITCMALEKLQRTYRANPKDEKSSAPSNFTTELQTEIKELFLKQDNELIITTETIKEKAVAGYLMGDEHGEEEVKKGIALMKAMAANNSTWAIGCLAGTYLEGHNNIIKINPQIAYQFLLQGEKLNDPNCLLLLGRYWSQGLGTHLPAAQRVDIKKGLEFLERSRALSYIAAYNELGNFHYTNENHLLAVENYCMAVELSLTTPKDEASEQTDVLAHAAANLARIYYKGYEEIPRDEKKALYYFDLAAVNGIVEAAMFLMNFYRKHDKTEEVIYYANIAAKLGEPTAQNFMQVMRSTPQYLPMVELYCSRQTEQIPIAEITFDASYSLHLRPKIADTASLTKLKAKSALPFFAVKSGEKIVDAVVQCKNQQDYTAIQKLQNDLHCLGTFFKNAKKKKFFVLKDVDALMSQVLTRSK
jgi:TPR repeat protein